MEEFKKYISIIKQILDRDYGKERVFFNDGDWYDRNTYRNLSLEELEKEVMDVFSSSEKDAEYIQLLTEKIYELMGDEKAEAFLDSIDK